MNRTNKILIFVIIILVALISLFSGFLLQKFLNPENSAEYKVGNSTFSVPKEYGLDPNLKEAKMPYGNRTYLNSSDKTISVTEFTSKESMDQEISNFRIPDKTIRGELLYKESNKTINGTFVTMFEDTGMPFKEYFFEKNDKWYWISIYLPDNSNIHDNIANMIISSLKVSSNGFNLNFNVGVE